MGLLGNETVELIWASSGAGHNRRSLSGGRAASPLSVPISWGGCFRRRSCIVVIAGAPSQVERDTWHAFALPFTTSEARGPSKYSVLIIQ